MRQDEQLYRRILGLRFFIGTASDSVRRMKQHGGLLVVPAAPALKDLPTHSGYREALLGADLAITDSALMVLVWRFLHGEKLRRTSGLEYLEELLKDREMAVSGSTFWIMANPLSAARNLDWLASQGLPVPESHVYLAPMYHGPIDDPALLRTLEQLRPRHIIVTVGGGTQERLGYYLKQRLSYRPAIHCIGAAIAFLSGDQVQIPVWADRAGLGWLLRCLWRPQSYVPRYWAARKLVALMIRYRDELPPSQAA
jgi:N-acetylglucosaminyldiphosphoundecaprenol N-acetyl-beta-D-mannosaminyltransferase